MRVAVIGAGNVGRGLGQRLAAAGHEVVYGVRDVAAWAGPGAARTVGEAAAWAEVVFLAVPWQAAVDALRAAGDLTGKVLIDATNPVGWDGGPTVAPTERGSGGETVAAHTSAAVVKAFNTFGAEFHASATVAGRPVDVLFATDDARARATVEALCRDAGFRPIDAGPLRNARLLEHHAVLWIHLARFRGAGRAFTFQLVSEV